MMECCSDGAIGYDVKIRSTGREPERASRASSGLMKTAVVEESPVPHVRCLVPIVIGTGNHSFLQCRQTSMATGRQVNWGLACACGTRQGFSA